MAELGVRYANALFKLSMERGLLNEYMEQAVFLRDMIKNSDFARIIGHPEISAADKRDFLKKAFSGKIYDDLLGFMHLVIAKNRENFLAPALTAFINEGERYKGNVVANVVSASELSEDQISTLKNMLSKKTNKHVEIVLSVDESLIGGLSIHVDRYLVDRTIKKQLNDMKDTIKRSTSNDFHA